MKNLITFLLALLLMVPAAEVQAQNKALEKALKKEFKAKQKEFKKVDGKSTVHHAVRTLFY